MLFFFLILPLERDFLLLREIIFERGVRGFFVHNNLFVATTLIAIISLRICSLYHEGKIGSRASFSEGVNQHAHTRT